MKNEKHFLTRFKRYLGFVDQAHSWGERLWRLSLIVPTVAAGLAGFVQSLPWAVTLYLALGTLALTVLALAGWAHMRAENALREGRIPYQSVHYDNSVLATQRILIIDSILTRITEAKGRIESMHSQILANPSPQALYLNQWFRDAVESVGGDNPANLEEYINDTDLVPWVEVEPHLSDTNERDLAREQYRDYRAAKTYLAKFEVRLKDERAKMLNVVESAIPHQEFWAKPNP